VIIVAAYDIQSRSYYDVYVNRYGGQLIYTKTERFPSDSDTVEVKVSAMDTPELFYVQLCANLERSVVHWFIVIS